MTMPGMKWWTWRSATRTLRNGPSVPRRRIEYVESRARPNVTLNAAIRLKSAFSRGVPVR